MFARVRESISTRAANRVRPLRRRLKAGVASRASETQSHQDDHSSMDHHHPHHDHLDNASVHSTITVETTRTPTNENRKPTANPNLRPHTQVFCGLSEDPSLEPTEVLERAQSDITKLAVYMQQIQLTRPVTAAFMGLVRGDNRTWEAIAVDILRQKARWDNITLEDCEGEYLDTILAFLFHLDNCAFLHLSNLLLSANGAWTLQSIVFCRNLSKLQLDLIDLSFAMPMLCRGLKSNMSLQCLIASRCGLNDDRLHELFTSLPKQLQELRIFGNKCREKGLAAITNVVHHSQHLRILDMSYQHVDPKNPNDGEFDVSWLAGALHHNKVLRVLDLDNDGIDDGHLTHLCAALCSNDTLEELMLNHNLITATGITLLSSKFGEMKGLKKISMYSNLFDAPEVDALVTENLQPTPREVPVKEQVEEECTSDLEDEFDEEIDYEEEIIVAHFDVVVDDDDDDNSSEGEMMSDNSSTPPPSADFREPDEAMNDSLPGDQDYDEAPDEADQEEGEAAEEDNEEADNDDDPSFPPSHIHIELPEQSQVEAIPSLVEENGENATINDENEEKSSLPEAPKSLDAALHQETTVILEKLHSEEGDSQTLHANNDTRLDNHIHENEQEQLVINDADNSSEYVITDVTKEITLACSSAQVQSLRGVEAVNSDNETTDPVGEKASDDDALDDPLENAPLSQLPSCNHNDDHDDSNGDGVPDVVGQGFGSVHATTHATEETTVDNSSTLDGFLKENENRTEDSNAEFNTKSQESSVENIQDSSVRVALPLHPESRRDDSNDGFNGGEENSEMHVNDGSGGIGSPVGPSIVLDDADKHSDEGGSRSDEESHGNMHEPTLDGATSCQVPSEHDDEQPKVQGLESTDGGSTTAVLKEEAIFDNSSNQLEPSTILEESAVANSDVDLTVSAKGDDDKQVQEVETEEDVGGTTDAVEETTLENSLAPQLEHSNIPDNDVGVDKATHDHVPEVTDNVSELADGDGTTNGTDETTVNDAPILVESATNVLDSEEDVLGTTENVEETTWGSSSAQLQESSKVLDFVGVDKATNDRAPEVSEALESSFKSNDKSASDEEKTTNVSNLAAVKGTRNVTEERTVDDSMALLLLESTNESTNVLEEAKESADSMKETDKANHPEIENVATIEHNNDAADNHHSDDPGTPDRKALEEVDVEDMADDAIAVTTTLDDSSKMQGLPVDSSSQVLPVDEGASAESDQGNDETVGDTLEDEVGHLALQEISVVMDE